MTLQVRSFDSSEVRNLRYIKFLIISIQIQSILFHLLSKTFQFLSIKRFRDMPDSHFLFDGLSFPTTTG